ncbi:MAG TPA: O-acetyl-ADP-ribose deacetylase [Flavisolibacter sp.]|nr:O-acetyl-ADP-ribose deacetylase [Flavisolibacter sp.]
MKERIELIRGDITKIKADAIVNAANSSLMGGGGVDGAIHRAGGPQILAACKEIIALHGPLKTGEAVATTAGKLNAGFVIHTVGPVWHGGKDHENEKLASCYLNSLLLAKEKNCDTIAFPNISTGVYGFPKASAARISLNTIIEFLAIHSRPEVVFLVCYDEENYHYIQDILSKLN